MQSDGRGNRGMAAHRPTALVPLVGVALRAFGQAVAGLKEPRANTASPAARFPEIGCFRADRGQRNAPPPRCGKNPSTSATRKCLKLRAPPSRILVRLIHVFLPQYMAISA
jgi:hypothetical protein